MSPMHAAQRTPRRNAADRRGSNSRYDVAFDGEEMTHGAFESLCTMWCRGLLHRLLCTLCLTGFEGDVHGETNDSNAAKTTDEKARTSTSSARIGHHASHAHSSSSAHGANSPVLVQVTNLP